MLPSTVEVIPFLEWRRSENVYIFFLAINMSPYPVAKGKKLYDKRHDIAERDAKRAMDRRNADAY